MQGGAIFDSTGTYRYRLWRQWDDSRPAVAFVMLNPSTADANADDPTIRRCLGFARAWGFGRLEVVNLFGYCSPSPRDLECAADVAGPDNAMHIASACDGVDVVVAAWGNFNSRRLTSPRLPVDAWCLGLTAMGNPRHPLYVSASTSLRRFAPGPAAERRRMCRHG